ncbi:MAG: hypothetical protein MZV70_33475 [Desulfobacterales bacterium]|nr:hypothetical protein [Desulfobacterales bacterium]
MNAPLGVSVRDSVGNLVMVNSAWKKIWALSDEAVSSDMGKTRTALQFDDTDSYLAGYNQEVKRIYTEGGQLFIPQLEGIRTPTRGSLVGQPPLLRASQQRGQGGQGCRSYRRPVRTGPKPKGSGAEARSTTETSPRTSRSGSSVPS